MALPDLIPYSDYGGDFGAFIEAVHNQFAADFFNCTLPEFCGRRLILNRNLFDGKCATFWHLTSEGKIEEERNPDLRRCECIAWVRHMINHRWTGEFAYWRAGKRLIIALRDFSYLVVLGSQRNVVVLITAHHKEHQHGRDQLRRQYEQADEKFR